MAHPAYMHNQSACNSHQSSTCRYARSSCQNVNGLKHICAHNVRAIQYTSYTQLMVSAHPFVGANTNGVCP